MTTRIVGKGTASVGEPKEVSALKALELKSSDSGEPRILIGLKAGDELPSRDVLITQEYVNRRLEITTDPMDWYKGESPWGGTILPPRTMFDALALLPSRKIEAVSFYGATELRNVNGPVKVGVSYRASGKIVFVGTSPKTEYYWYDSWLEEKDSGKRVAEMRHMIRFMKASSPLYQSR